MTNGPEPNNASDTASDTQFDALLQYLKRTRAFDFAAYKRASLMRRINRRMQVIGIASASFGDYVDYLEVHPDEFGQLFNGILINVTAFFRDPPAWDLLRQDIIPRILSTKQSQQNVRVWSAGCASGEEAYSIAMLLADAMPPDQFRQQVKIYATDIDEEALNQARLASYSHEQVGGVSAESLGKYFEQTNGRYVFRPDLRRAVIFGRHDLIKDAPISRVDLLVCRNTLMYFNAETQSHILNRFDFALNAGGYIFLGKAEVMLTRVATFVPVDLKRRIFAKVAMSRLGEHTPGAQPREKPAGAGNPADDTRLLAAALEGDPTAQLVVSVNGTIVSANESARTLLGLTVDGIGRPFGDLASAHKPVDLSALIEQVYLERRSRAVREVEWPAVADEQRFLDVTAVPIRMANDVTLGVKIILADVTRVIRLQKELQQSQQELETTNEELQSANEELETTNEELQSTNEELETTNEELQSTNEELETINEELQSTNEELEATNEELRQRGDELDKINGFLQSILSSLRDGVIVLDRNMQIIAWNICAEDLWGLRSEEVEGKHFLNLDIGLPVEQLRQPIRACLAGEVRADSMLLAATNRRGKATQVKISCTQLCGASGTIQGVILFMEETRALADTQSIQGGQ